MTAPLQQPTGDRHVVGGVEWRRVGGDWYAVAHGHVLVSNEDAAVWAEYRPVNAWRLASTAGHAMRNALRWARAHPVTHRPAVRRARAEFARLVGAES
jgi:hypothetical protein